MKHRIPTCVRVTFAVSEGLHTVVTIGQRIRDLVEDRPHIVFKYHASDVKLLAAELEVQGEDIMVQNFFRLVCCMSWPKSPPSHSSM